MHNRKQSHIIVAHLATVAGTILLCGGCASKDVRKHQEAVAKGWCEMVRASQVIPVYPLTEDLRVGDVFMVQTPISTEERNYREKGFLALDDHRTRLAYTNFTKTYFDGYWMDSFGKAPHPMRMTTNCGPIALTSCDAPRAAFPSYSFQAQSGFGLSAAFPIQGVPVALGFLGTDQVNGSISISDARTYAGDKGDLLQSLYDWARNDSVRSQLRATAKNAAPAPIYLRVVTRVYMARSLEVSLAHANQRGMKARGGLDSNLALLNTNGTVNENYSRALEALDAGGSVLSAATQIGGNVKFVSVSSSTVGLAQSFDRPLVIGYLGFDVPVYENGTVGISSIPTFQRLTSGAEQWFGPTVESWNNLGILGRVFRNNPHRAVALMSKTVMRVDGREFRLVEDMLSGLSPESVDYTNDVANLVKEFKKATSRYLVRPNLFSRKRSSQRCTQFNDAFAEALVATAAFAARQEAELAVRK